MALKSGKCWSMYHQRQQRQIYTKSSAPRRQFGLGRYLFSLQELSKKHSQTQRPSTEGKNKLDKGQRSASPSSNKKTKEAPKKNETYSCVWTIDWSQLQAGSTFLEGMFAHLWRD